MANRSDLIDELLTSYLKIPVLMSWDRASGLPIPDRFENARVEFQGIATSWLELQQIVCDAREVRLVHGLPAKLCLTTPGIEIAIGQNELDRWLSRFQLPYRLELGEEALVVHTEIAGFPIAQFETSIEVEGGWFVLKPKRAALFGVPGYFSSMFRNYLPIPPISSESRLTGVSHAPGLLRLRFEMNDFEEEITPGLLLRLRKKYFPVIDQLSGWVAPT